jgi:hypothetical protein
MDDAAERFARDIADAIAAAFASDAGIAACQARAQAEGYDLQVSIEATIGLAPVDDAPRLPAVLDLSAHDRRLLRSLRIAADEAAEVE